MSSSQIVESFATEQEFDDAVETAVGAAAAYYHSATLLMTDAEYDELVERIAHSLDLHPDWDARGLLDEVAAGTTSTGDVAHPTAMLSLDKAKEETDLQSFLDRISGADTCTEVKLDGIAVRAEYRDGHLALVATRGDGNSGEDITRRARDASGLPPSLPQPLSFEVRGEVFMTDEDFTVASANRVAAGKSAFVNPRNATAGVLRNEDADYEAPLSFAAYDSSGGPLDSLPSYQERMQHVSSLGIRTALSLLPDLDFGGNPPSVIAEIAALRESLNFPIDGAVVKVDSYAVRETLGAASRHPRWAIAWKFPAAEAESTLRDIEVTIGRTGRLALTAVIDPVYVAGATVTRATLHNVDFVVKQGLGIGSRVVVVRAGDVIPRVTAKMQEDSTSTPWQPPPSCPQCGDEWDKASVLWRCRSTQCSTVAALTYWASRDCLDIERLGEAACEALVSQSLASTVADLYDLRLEDLAALPMGVNASGSERMLGELNAREILLGLERSKQQPLHRVITGLGIRMTGRSVGRWLAQHFGSMQALRAASVEEIAEIHRLGEVKARSIVEGLAAMGPVIDRLEAAGLTMTDEDAAEPGARPLSGMTIVVTGAMSGPLDGLSRNEMNELIERNGGKASGSVSAKTSLLVCGEEGSSKYQKAVSLGVRVVTPEVFASMISS